MRNKFFLLAVFSAYCFAFNSCKQEVPELSLYVPKDAQVVVAIDPKTITDKINSSGISLDSLANLFDDKKDNYALHWNDIKNSGIDLNKKVYCFFKPSNSVKDGKVSYSGVIAQVEDPKKLEAFIQKAKLGGDIQSSGKYKYYLLDADEVAGWTDKIFIVSSVRGGYVASGNYRTGEGTPAQLYLNTMFTQSESSSIASVEEFRNAFSKDGDVQLFSSGSASLSSIPMLGFTNLNNLLEGSYTSGTINFDKGRAIASVETHNSKALSDILKKYPSKEIDKTMITRYPVQMKGFFVMSFDPKILLEILHYASLDGMLNNYSSELGFDANDVVSALSGDVALIISPGSGKPIEKVTPQGNITTSNYTNFLVNLRIGNKSAFDKVMNGLVRKNILSKNGDYYQLGFFGGQGFSMKANDKELLIATNNELIEAYESGTGKTELPESIDKMLANKTAAIYVDINGLLNSVHGKDTTGSNVLAIAKSTFKDANATSEKGDGKVLTSSLQLNFMNQNENSLASLVKFLAVAREESLRHKSDVDMRPNYQDSIPPAEEEPEKDSQ